MTPALTSLSVQLMAASDRPRGLQLAPRQVRGASSQGAVSLPLTHEHFHLAAVRCAAL